MKTKPQSEEYKAFENLLSNALSVSKSELNKRIEEEKREKLTTASRASDDSSKQA